MGVGHTKDSAELLDIASEPGSAWKGVYFLRHYHPYRIHGSRNLAFNNETDGRLLDLKNNRDPGVWEAAKDSWFGLERLSLTKRTVLVVVPGHEERPSNVGRPLARVAECLAKADGRFVAGIDSLIRSSTVPKKSHGGMRDFSVELASITVSKSPNLSVETVVILDDVVTTGTSMTVARHLCKAAGAKRVAAVALGRTVRNLM